VRIGQLLASEIAGNEGRLRNLAVADADPDVEPTPDGALAYRVVRGGEGSGADGDEVKAESEEKRGTSSPRPMFSRTGSGSNLSRGGEK